MRLVKPKKFLGQHFLKDLKVAQDIADTVDACPNLPILEVGPGMGVLNVCEGVMSLRNVKNIPLFILYTLLIWGCYFYHFYLTFYSFSFAEHLGFQAAMVMFVGGTFAVIVPTPNGAGPWHFAVITMMMLYGVNATDAGAFALIVHGIQTLLVVLLGIYGGLHVSLVNRTK